MDEESPSTDLKNGVKISTSSGVAQIKQEYIVPVEKLISEGNETSSNNLQPQNARNEFPNKKKKSGKYSNRPKLVKQAPGKKLCRYYWCLLPGENPGPDKCPLDKCCFSHDFKGFLENKPEDIGNKCHNFLSYGFCNYGIICRYGGCHIESCGSLVNEELRKEYQLNPPVRNSLKKEIQISLRKRKYNFSKAQEALKEVQLINEARQKLKTENALNQNVSDDCNKISDALNVDIKKENHVTDTPCDDIKRLGPANDEDMIPLRPQEKKKIDWRDKLYLAPLTTLGNLPYRRVCKKLGADVTCSEMAVATCLLQGSNSEWALVKRHSSEDLFGVQLCGSNAEAMTKCSQLLNQEIEMDFVDINMGCPIDLIFKQGGGSALLRRTSALNQMIQGMTRVLSCPLTLKMRTAVYRDTKVAHTIIDTVKLWDISLITLHGRSKEQRYLKLADWDYIKECAAVADPVPLFGNGDILSYDSYIQHKNESNVAGVMLARGALMKPWIFTEIKEAREWDISSTERLDILREFTNYGMEHWGSDTEGVEKTRRFLLEWLSFLYRYIPVGLLERPQKINERPPVYVGRNDLETLMASNKVKDWVKISEMLLGSVPDDFDFLPKHKGSSWT